MDKYKKIGWELTKKKKLEILKKSCKENWRGGDEEELRMNANKSTRKNILKQMNKTKQGNWKWLKAYILQGVNEKMLRKLFMAFIEYGNTISYKAIRTNVLPTNKKRKENLSVLNIYAQVRQEEKIKNRYEEI